MSDEREFGGDVDPSDVITDDGGLVAVAVAPMQFRVIEGNGDGYRGCLVDLDQWACGCGKNNNGASGGETCKHVLSALFEFKQRGGLDAMPDRQDGDRLDGLTDRLDGLRQAVEDLSDRLDERQAPVRQDSPRQQSRVNGQGQAPAAQSDRQASQRERQTDGGQASQQRGPTRAGPGNEQGYLNRADENGRPKPIGGRQQSPEADPQQLRAAAIRYLDEFGFPSARMKVDVDESDRRVYFQPDGLSDDEFGAYMDLCKSDDLIQWHGETKRNYVSVDDAPDLFGGDL